MLKTFEVRAVCDEPKIFFDVKAGTPVQISQGVGLVRVKSLIDRSPHTNGWACRIDRDAVGALNEVMLPWKNYEGEITRVTADPDQKKAYVYFKVQVETMDPLPVDDLSTPSLVEWTVPPTGVVVAEPVAMPRPDDGEDEAEEGDDEVKDDDDDDEGGDDDEEDDPYIAIRRSEWNDLWGEMTFSYCAILVLATAAFVIIVLARHGFFASH